MDLQEIITLKSFKQLIKENTIDDEQSNDVKQELSKEDEQAVIDLLKKQTPENINDDIIHKLADELKVSTPKVEAFIYSLAIKHLQEETVEGGKADNKTLEDIAKKHNVNIDDIQKEFEVGIEVEQEHTNDLETAEEIAKDHLFEIPDYYTKLIKAKIVDEVGALELYKQFFKNEDK